MDVLLIAAGVFLVGLTGWLLVRGALLPRIQFGVHIRDVDSYGFQAEVESLPEDRQRVGLLRVLAATLGRTLARLVPALPALPRHDLTAAGIYELSPEAMHGYRLLCVVMLESLFLLMTAAGGPPGTLGILVLLAVPALAWQLPAVWVHHRGRKRLDAIDRELPQLLDLLVATIEAGLGFAGALQLVSDRVTGPLGNELRLTLQEQSLGVSNQKALEALVERCDTPSMRAFARTMSRTDSHGISVGPVLRNLAADVRKRRRDLAKERIQKAPIKMLFPLIMLIFPALLIVILFPAGYNLFQALGSV